MLHLLHHREQAHEKSYNPHASTSNVCELLGFQRAETFRPCFRGRRWGLQCTLRVENLWRQQTFLFRRISFVNQPKLTHRRWQVRNESGFDKGWWLRLRLEINMIDFITFLTVHKSSITYDFEDQSIGFMCIIGGQLNPSLNRYKYTIFQMNVIIPFTTFSPQSTVIFPYSHSLFSTTKSSSVILNCKSNHCKFVLCSSLL